MGEFKKVGKTDEVPAGQMKLYQVGLDRVLICNTGDGYHALADECTHDSAPISQGRLKGKEIICPRHGARFDVTSGAVTSPPAVVPIDTFEVKIEGNDIYVWLEE